MMERLFVDFIGGQELRQVFNMVPGESLTSRRAESIGPRIWSWQLAYSLCL